MKERCWKWVTSLSVVSLIMLFGCSEDVADMTGSVYGKVRDRQTGQAIAGALVTITPGSSSHTTGSDGAYEFKGLKPAEYVVAVNATDYEEDSKKVTIVTGKSNPMDFSLDPVKALELNTGVLHFGKDNSSLTFEIKNTGKKAFNWNISGLKDVIWLEVNPATGALDGGRSCSVQVNIIRENLKKNADATLIVNSDKESVSLKVTAEAVTENKAISVEPSKLDFGKDETSLTFNIKNTGNTNGVKWNITGLDVDWLTLSPMEGTLDVGKTHTVKAVLKREQVKGSVKGTVLVNGAGNSYPVEFIAEEKLARVLTANPSSLEFGDEKTEILLNLTSQNGSTDYTLEKRGDNTTWLELSKNAGTIPKFDAANPAMKESITVKVDRTSLNAGSYTCKLVVKSDLKELEIPVTMTVKEKPAREFKVQPDKLDIGTNDNGSITMYAYNGDTSYQLLTEENVSWLSFEKSSGTVQAETNETVQININRGSLSAGEYSCTVVVRTDLGEKKIPLTMKVEEQGTGTTGIGTVISCSDDLEFTVISCKLSGSKATLSFQVKNISSKSIDLQLYGTSSGKSYIYDDYANAYEFGSQQSYLKLGEKESSSGVFKTIPEGVTLNGAVVIPNVSDDASAFANVSVYAYQPTQSLVTFKNVPIEGRTAKKLPSSQTSGTVASCSDDLEFTIVDCKRGSTGNVTLSYRVKNISKNTKELQFYGTSSGKSSIYDNLGNSYAFGSQQSYLTLGYKGSSSGVYMILPAEVSLNGSVVVVGASADATELTNVTIYAYQPSGQAFVFKNVKIR